MEFEATLKNGILEVFPVIEKIPNKEGGTDIVVHALNPALIQKAKSEIIQKLAMGIPVELGPIKEESEVEL